LKSIDFSAAHWNPIRSANPSSIPDRLQLHVASQIPASLGYTLYRHVPDHGHTALVWSDWHRALVSNRQEDGVILAGLRIHDMTLLLIDSSDCELASFELQDQTLEQGYTWLEENISDHLGKATSLTRPDHDLPDSPVSTGATFEVDVNSLEEFESWYQNANELLQAVAKEFPTASDVRCWPHHFDIATLVQFDPDKEAEIARSIGVGFSPGDGSFDAPYWYILPWPAPEKNILSDELVEAGWHANGWMGGVLKSEQIRLTSANDQKELVSSFVQSAVGSAADLLELRLSN
jgi:hypothetical protein